MGNKRGIKHVCVFFIYQIRINYVFPFEFHIFFINRAENIFEQKLKCLSNFNIKKIVDVIKVKISLL
jgi:hypothetical protein